jgi:hypothetical protein
MDAYELFWKIKTIWMDNTDKNSGVGPKNTIHMATMVMTKNGYREVVAAKWNKEIKAIELILDED